MSRLAKLALLLALCAPLAHAQFTVPFARENATASVVTPAFVSEMSSNSTLTNAVTTRVSTTTTCVDYGYCFHYTDEVLSGNLGIVSFQYNHATTSVLATVTDDGSNTYTCIASVQVGVTGDWVDSCYATNMSPAFAVTITFGTTAVTQVMAKAASFTRVALSSALDASTVVSGTSGSSCNAASVTTTAANDLIYVYCARVGTPATTSFTAGSGYTLGTEDIHDGGVAEYGVDASTGSITPSLTMATSSTYGEAVLAFKAANAGTAPTGTYIEREMSWGFTAGTSGSLLYQFTSSGNFLTDTLTCGTGMVPSGASSTSNGTWSAVGSPYSDGLPASYANMEYYVGNAAADSTGAVTVTTTGTGDCTSTFYSVANAPSSPVVTRASYGDSGSYVPPIQWTPWQVGPFLPSPTAGIAFAVGGQIDNTTTSMTKPASGCYFDSATSGGENVNGPWPLWQNNTWAHCFFSSGNSVPFTFGYTNANDMAGWIGDILAVFGSSGVGIKNAATEQAAGAATLAITVPSTTSGNLGAVAIGNYNATARTVSSVCFDGTTCAAGNAMTQFSGSTSTGSGHAATTIFYLLNLPSAKTTLTVTLSGSASNVEAYYYEVQKGSGASWATDGANQTTNGTGSGTTLTGPSVTTTGSADFCLAANGVSNETTASPASGNEYQYGGTLYSVTVDGASSLLTTVAGSHAPAWTDNTSGDSFSASNGCFK